MIDNPLKTFPHFWPKQHTIRYDPQSMTAEENYLNLDQAKLLSQCEVHIYRSSGPGGQHRNKVSSAVRLKHRPTGITVTATESRSQHENKRNAVTRLRMKIACTIRRPVNTKNLAIPAPVNECLFSPKKTTPSGVKRLEVGRKNQRFWPVAAFLLDLLQARSGRLAQAADLINITTSNLTSVLKSERHLFAAAQQIRRQNGLGNLS